MDPGAMVQLFFGPHQVDHLLLLVGSNPLPNAVAGSLMTKPGGTISLIFSAQSSGVARRLQQWLGGRGFQVNLPREVGESDRVSILERVQTVLGSNLGDRVGLNYTGGTKAMSVHAYRGVEHWARDQGGREVIFSYLDARQLNMVVEPADPHDRSQQPPIYTGGAVTISLREMVDLHGWDSGRMDLGKPLFPGVAKEIRVAVAREDTRPAWYAWRKDVFRALASRDPELPKPRWKDVTALRNLMVPYPMDSGLTELKRAMEAEFAPGISGFHLGQTAARMKPDPTDFCDWLDAEWLDSAVYHALQACRTACDLHWVAQNVKPHVPGAEDFDLDVAALRGYQLFAFSCTTSSAGGRDRNQTKHRLFEVIIRARQIGGDEACIALVCAADPEQVASLETEVRHAFSVQAGGGAPPAAAGPAGRQAHERIKVFGIEDWVDLEGNLQRWIEHQSRMN